METVSQKRDRVYLYIAPSTGQRTCKRCNLEAGARYRARKRSAEQQAETMRTVLA